MDARWAIAVLALHALGPGPLPAQSPWPIKTFEVVNVEPAGDVQYQSGATGFFESVIRSIRDNSLGFDPDFLPGTRTVPLDSVTRRTMESYLHDAAVQLEAWGFPAPTLQPVVTTPSGDRAYRVYLVANIPGEVAHYAPKCGSGGEKVVMLNASRVVDGRGLTLLGYEALGHELFHAVQRSTAFLQCAPGEVGEWIKEGQARAIGWDLIRVVRETIALDSADVSRWGPRSYRLALPGVPPVTHDRAPAFGTSSFWRYLAEAHAARLYGGSKPGPEVNPVDYGILAQLLRQGPAVRDCGDGQTACDAELQWLDGGLRRTLGADLRDVYSDFLQALALYGEHRPAEGLNGPRWRSMAFPCTPVSLRPIRYGLTTYRDQLLVLTENSAHCFAVDIQGFGRDVVVSVTVEGQAGQAALEDLTAGIAGRPIDAEKAPLHVDPRSGAQRAIWVYELPNDTSYVLLANMADDPSRSLDMTRLPYTIRVEGFASMSEGGGGGPTPSDIDRPLEIELDSTTVNDVVAPAEGVCRMQFSFLNPTTGDAVGLMMNHEGPIQAGDYPIHNPGRAGTFDMRYVEDHPGVFNVGFSFGPGNGMTNGFTFGYIGRDGTVSLDLVSPKLVRGSLSVTGERNVCLDEQGRPSSLSNRFDCPAPNGMGVQAVFSVRPEGAGTPTPSAACFEAGASDTAPTLPPAATGGPPPGTPRQPGGDSTGVQRRDSSGVSGGVPPAGVPDQPRPGAVPGRPGSGAASTGAGVFGTVNRVRLVARGAVDTTIVLTGPDLTLTGGCDGRGPASIGMGRGGNMAPDWFNLSFETADVVGAGATGVFPLGELTWDRGTVVPEGLSPDSPIRVPNRFRGPGVLNLDTHVATGQARRMAGTIQADALTNRAGSTVSLTVELDVNLSCGIGPPGEP